MSSAQIRPAMVIIIIFCLSLAAYAMDRSGTISEDETWTIENSPVLITGVLNIDFYTRLTIEPGVEVRFAPGAALMINGSLTARGTETDSIRFTAAEGDKAGSWGGIYINGGTDDPLAYDDEGQFTGESTLLEYCVIEFAGDRYVDLGSSIQVSSANPLIAHSTIRHSGGESGTIQVGDGAMPLIRNCRIAHNQAERGGAVNAGIGSRPKLWNNIVEYNSSEDNGGAFYLSLADMELIGNAVVGNEATSHGGALYGAVVSDLVVRNNAFIGNSSRSKSNTIFFTGSVSTVIKNNQFDSTGVAIYLDQATNDIDVTENYWAYTTGFDFRALFRDKQRDRYEPNVFWDPPLSAPPVGLLTNPTQIDSIILCRDDRFSDEIPYGVAEGAPLRIRLKGTDPNPGFRDVISVKITSAMDVDGILVPLWETSRNSGLYIGKSRVAAASSQKQYLIGDLEGGEVQIFSPTVDGVQAVYETMSPKPACEPFQIADEMDSLNVVSHSPKFKWGYFDVLERDQVMFRLKVFEHQLPDMVPPKNFIPDSDPIWETEVNEEFKNYIYDGIPLEDGESYLAQLSVSNGEFWSDVLQLPFRMNSLPTPPTPMSPTEDEIVTTRSPMLTSSRSSDRENDSLRYYFELYLIENKQNLPVQVSDIFSTETETVTWTPGTDLEENKSYRFQVRAYDPFEEGPPCEFKTFHVNSLEEPPTPFDLLLPVVNDTIFDLHPLISWQQTTDPDPLSSVKYGIDLSHSDNFSTIQNTYNIDGETEITIPDSLNNESTYYWRVTATDNTGLAQVASITYNFYVSTTPSVPIPTNPVAGEELMPNAALLWEESVDPDPTDFIRYEVDLYEISIEEASGAGEIVALKRDWVANTVKLKDLDGWDNLKDNTEYGWRVRARDNHNAISSFSKSGAFFFNLFNNPPERVTSISAPTDTVMGNNTITFEWGEVQDPDLSDPPWKMVYEIECVIGEPDFSGGNVSKYSSAEGETSLAVVLEDNKLWNYRIRSKDDDDSVSVWSEIKSVLVNIEEDYPAPFALTHPIADAPIYELDSLKFVWESSSDPDWASSIEYKFELFPTDDKGEYFTITVTDPHYNFKRGLVNEASYRWQVTAIDNIGLETVCSTGFEFKTNTTPTAPQVVDLPDEILLEEELGFIGATDPNPSDKLTYNLEVSSTVGFEEVLINKVEFPHTSERMSAVIASLPDQGRLTDDEDYWFRVSATDNHGYTGAYSEPVKFRFNRFNDDPTTPQAQYAPTDSIRVRTTAPELSWQPSTDIDLSDPSASLVYDIRLDSDGEFSNSAYEFSTNPGQTTYKLPQNLTDNDVWSWQVRSRDNEGAVSPWSEIQAMLINVEDDAPSIPILTMPVNDAKMNILNPIVFKWNPSTDIDFASSISYRFEYDTAADMTNKVSIDNLIEPTYTIENQLLNTTYYWKVTAVDNTDLETESKLYSVVLDTRPTVPILTSPEAGTELLITENLSWNLSSDPNPQDVIVYDVQVSMDESFSTVVAHSENIDAGSIAVASLIGNNSMLDNTVYHWRVKARDNHTIESDWSSSSAFFYNSENNPPTMVGEQFTPAEGDELSSVTLTWTAATDPDQSDSQDKLSYKVELSLDRNFSGEINALKSDPGSTTIQPTGLQDDSWWYWRVRAFDDEGLEGAVSDIHGFIYNVRNDPPTAVADPLAPDDGSEVTTSTVSWGAADDQDVLDTQESLTYYVEFCTDNQFIENVLTVKSDPNTTEATHDNVTDNTIWYWRVRAVDDDGTEGTVSSVRSFQYNSVNDPPDKMIQQLQPANKTEVATLKLSWSPATDPDLDDTSDRLTYMIEISEDKAFTNAIKLSTIVGQTSITADGLADNTLWNWRIKAVDDQQLQGAWSETISFIHNVKNDPPNSVDKGFKPTNEVEVSTPTLSWEATTDPDWNDTPQLISYIAELSQSKDFTGRAVTLMSQPGQTSVQARDLADNSMWHWRVKSVDDDGLDSEWSSVHSFVYNVANEPPADVVSGFQPSDGAKLTSITTLSWDAVSDPDYNDPDEKLNYMVELSTTNNFAGNTIEFTLETNETPLLTVVPKGLTDNSIWYWRVKAVDDENSESSWSKVNNFTLNTKNDPPNDFTLISPANGTETTDTNINFKWNKAVDVDPNSEVKYTLTIAQDAGFNENSRNFSGLTENSLTPPSGTFQQGTTYYWKVVAEDSEGASTYGSKSNSAPWSFSIKAPPAPPPPQEGQSGTGG